MLMFKNIVEVTNQAKCNKYFEFEFYKSAHNFTYLFSKLQAKIKRTIKTMCDIYVPTFLSPRRQNFSQIL